MLIGSVPPWVTRKDTLSYKRAHLCTVVPVPAERDSSPGASVAGRNVPTPALDASIDQANRQVILVVEDDPDMMYLLTRMLRRSFPLNPVLTAETAESASAVVAERHVDIVVSDHRLPGLTGLEFLVELHERRPDVSAILMSGFPDPATAADAVRRAGIELFLSKPVHPGPLVDVLAAIMLERTAKKLRARSFHRRSETY